METIPQYETVQSAHLKVEEIFQKIRHLLNKHYEEYENKENISNIPCDESCTHFDQHDIDIEKMKESSEKIKQFNIQLSKLIPVYTNLKLNSCPLSNQENIVQQQQQQYTTTTTQYFDTIYKGVNNLKRLIKANEKLQNSLQKISHYTSLLPNLSENSTIPILDEILSSNKSSSSSTS
ncbi:unnamed protein product [Schistosoma rodhaini]|uniref:Mediator of RNA polymerase II transcription subunit 11 n=1 Tax=Schistosoma mansoni TaxID=6183 RepID=G4LY80_SCHMA|nr:hypothetical protein Smp_166230 [Schistosoma mansoni]CAH8618041.1 unnamed protein product [Schistosoma rodhaini]|eukprot:XP_018646218.1 hypothetical protein Smp_166230 [Schistosoma mansoni]